MPWLAAAGEAIGSWLGEAGTSIGQALGYGAESAAPAAAEGSAAAAEGVGTAAAQGTTGALAEAAGGSAGAWSDIFATPAKVAGNAPPTFNLNPAVVGAPASAKAAAAPADSFWSDFSKMVRENGMQVGSGNSNDSLGYALAGEPVPVSTPPPAPVGGLPRVFTSGGGLNALSASITGRRQDNVS